MCSTNIIEAQNPRPSGRDPRQGVDGELRVVRIPKYVLCHDKAILRCQSCQMSLGRLDSKLKFIQVCPSGSLQYRGLLRILDLLWAASLTFLQSLSVTCSKGRP